MVSSMGVGLAFLGIAAAGWAAPESPGVAGEVLAVDRATGRIVVGDTGPRLPSGDSEVLRRSIRVTPATEFVVVSRAVGAAPTGWTGDYVERSLAPWDVKPGEFVSVSIREGDAGPQALKVTVVGPEQ
jgi:hypothetical protein